MKDNYSGNWQGLSASEGSDFEFVYDKVPSNVDFQNPKLNG